MRLQIVKGIIALVLSIALWWGLMPAYTRLISSIAQPIKRMTESPSVTRLSGLEHRVIVDRDDFPPKSGRPSIPAEDITFNFIILATLFALSIPVFGTANVTRFLIACLILMITHALALFVEVQSIYATQLGAWSRAKYSVLERDIWTGLWHFYRVVGLYGIAIGIWFALRPTPPAVTASARSSAPRKRKRK